MTNRRTQITGVVLSAIMVLSMVALAFAAGAGATPGQSVDATDEAGTPGIATDSGVLADDRSVEPAEIKGNLLEKAEGEPVTAVVRLQSADTSKLTGDRDAVVDQLKSHAKQSQAPVIEAAQELESVTVLNQLWIANAVVVESTTDGLQELAKVSGVDRIHPNFELTVPETSQTTGDASEAPRSGDVSADQTYGLDMINAPQVWDEFDNQGEGAEVAILDSGYDNDHPDLPKIDPDDQWQEFNETGDPVPSDPKATTDHGTHVSGTVVGSDNPSVVDRPFGVAPEATLYNGLVLPGGGGSLAQIMAGMQYAVDTWEVDIIGMSLGPRGGGFLPGLIEPSGNARAAGIIVTASAGNGGLGNTGSPGNIYPNFASGAVDENRDKAGFSAGEEVNTQSARGSDAPDYFPDNYIVPNAAAPGVSVLSTVPGGAGTKGGTSMSQPHKAGLFALMVSQAGGEFDRENFIQIVEETATQPDNAPSEDPNIEYGHGIVDAYAAVSQVDTGPEVPEFDVGDVNEDGNVSIVDAVRIQQHLADINVSINENLADVDRSGEIGIVDAVLLQQFLAEQISDGEMTVSNLDAPDSVPGGETITVEADMENVGGLGMFGQADFRLAGSEGGLDDPNTTLATNYHDLAPAGNDNHTATTSFEIDTSGVPGGEYHHGVFSGDDNASDTITITQPFFDVASLDAPAEVVEDSEITVNATIENTGNENATQDVEFRFAGNTLLTEEDVTLNAGESTQVTFEPTVAADPGTYEHGVFTNDASLTANITVIESVFSVSGVSGPANIVHGDSYTVDATIENTGNATDTQTVEYELGNLGAGERVAIVSPAASSRGGDDALQTILTERLPDLTIEQIDSADLLSEIDNYDMFVVLRFGATDENSAGDTRASDFYSQLGDTQGAVYMDTETGASDEEYSNAINRLHRVVGLTDTYDDSSDVSGKPIEITADHPIFTGVGSVGDVFDTTTEGIGDYSSSWTGYSGTTIGDLATEGEGAVGVSDDGLEVLMANAAPEFFSDQPSSFTPEANATMANAVEFVATGGVSSDSGAAVTEEVTLDPGESTTVEFNYTVTADDGIGEQAHVVESNDDGASQAVSVTAPDQIEITDYDTPAEARQNAEIDIDVSLEHVGAETTTQDVAFTFGPGLIELTETVTMSPGDTQTVTFDVSVPENLTPGEYEHNASVNWDEASNTTEILEGDPANFAVSGLSAPPEAGQFDTFNVSATIENTGDFEGTQAVEYDFDVDVGDGPGDEPELEDVSVAVIDEQDYHNGASRAQVDAALDNDTFTTVDLLEAPDVLDQMGNYDVFVVQRFGSDSLASDFLDNLGDDQGVVYLDSYQGGTAEAYADGVYRLNNVRGDPVDWDDTLNAATSDLVIQEDHPIFDGVGSPGDEVRMFDGDSNWGSWFFDYSGQVLAEISHEGTAGPGVGVSTDNNEILLPAVGWDFFGTPGDSGWTNESQALLGNSVRHTAEMAAGIAGSSQATDEGTVSDGDIVTIDDQPFKLAATKEVTIAGGESTTVEFEFQVPGNLPEGTYGHGVFSEDDDQAAEIFIFEQSPDIEVTGHFLEDNNISVGEDLVTQATVVNNGDVAGEQEIQLNVDSQVRDTVTVQLDAGEVRQVELSTTMTQTGDFVVSVNGQDPQVVTVTNSTATAATAAPVSGPLLG